MTNITKFVKALEAMGVCENHGRPVFYTKETDNEIVGDGQCVTVWDYSDENDVRYVDYYFADDGSFNYMDIRHTYEDAPVDDDNASATRSCVHCNPVVHFCNTSKGVALCKNGPDYSVQEWTTVLTEVTCEDCKRELAEV